MKKQFDQGVGGLCDGKVLRWGSLATGKSCGLVRLLREWMKVQGGGNEYD